ncbi:putative RDD family membrane protein YckC [Actinoplanes lutulentus]|uniref:Putative RDD family membrane protein YckC n=1 Tax=Actinoplanes lutulentus TaxID=1287878 RepID=A0A327ZCR7_9ACTN|nr:RDD family protein [Actinoplanes lutulentus]MBB2945751.1 putative RDD family membrane protein YckC [Actinoplanes lutulentus]RAK37800.1 putative RDD family membrane protein YckC [Actinoplanes lutulentus]
MSSLPAGWYKDPADTSTQRYWDGDGWLGKAIPADEVPPEGPPAVEEEPAAQVSPAPITPAPQPQAQTQPPAPYNPPPGWQQNPQQGPPPQGWQQGPPPPGWQQGPPPPGWQQNPQQGPPQGYPQQYPQPTWAGQPPHAYLYPIPQAMPHGFPLAGLGRRLTARLIDIAVVLLLNVVVNGWFIYQYWQDFAPIMRDYMSQVEANSATATVGEPTARMQTLSIAIVLVATLLWLVYEAPSIAGRGQTIGKRLMGIKVVPVESTNPLGFGRAFTRWARLGMWTLFWWCGIGLVIQFFAALSPVFDSRLRQAWHDKAAATVVVAVPHGVQPIAPPGGLK